ncbi:MAG: two-component system, response regulator PdtaR [Gammaproteobacteria bacterium]|nr:two-component system, response regulator PdtaR [Gammaproteobacteria bacterium]
MPRPLPPVRIEVPVPGPWSDLIAGLQELGFDVSLAGERDAADLVVLIVDGSFPATEANNAFLVVARQHSLRAAKTAIAGGASGYFAAPFDFLSLGVAICAAASQARALASLTERTARMHASIEGDQTVSTVVGILMERFKLQRAEAYARLRRYSRTERRKVVELATELVASSEELSRTMRAIESGLEKN